MPRRHPNISNLSLKNFRGFKKADVSLAPLTILVGPNSAGKSALSASILLLVQSSHGAILDFAPSWNSYLVDLGSFKDTVYWRSDFKTIEIALRMAVGYSIYSWLDGKKPKTTRSVEVAFSIKQNKNKPVGYLKKVVVHDITSGIEIEFKNPWRYQNITRGQKAIIVLNLVEEKVSLNIKLPPKTMYGWYSIERKISQQIKKYIDSNKAKLSGKISGIKRCLDALNGPAYLFVCSEVGRVTSGRAGPRRFYSQQDILSSGHIYRGNSETIIFDRPDQLLSLQSNQERFDRSWDKKKTKETVRWLKKLGIASDIKFKRSSSYHREMFIEDNATKIKSNISDVGYGVSQVLPVIYGCLSGDHGLLFIEQPEIHLHPGAQSKLGELIVETSKKRQVFLETHSVHLINAIRVAILKNKIPHKHVVINYIDKDDNGSRVTTLGLDEKAEFTREWPEGFFEERYRQTKEILSLKSQLKDE